MALAARLSCWSCHEAWTRPLTNEVWLVFDAEDNGRINGWEFIAGSTHMAENLTVTPAFVVIADMVGDKDSSSTKRRTRPGAG